MKRTLALLLSLLIIIIVIVIPRPIHSAENAVKDFTLPSATDGSLIRLADHAGKVVLINWWRTSCGYSKQESPKLVELYNKYRDKGLVILGVFDKLSEDDYETVAEIPAYLKRYGITWPIGLNDQGEFMREIFPNGRGETPGNYLVSRSGKLTYLGLDRKSEDWQKLEEAVVRLLAEPKPGAPSIPQRLLEPAPAFSLPNLHGKTVSVADFSGKPLLVNFFTAGTCDWAGPVISRLYRDYAGRGLQVVGIDLFDQDAQIKNCIGKHGVKYPVLRGDEATQKAWIGSNKAWATFFVTPDGKMFKKIVDSIDNGLEAQVFPWYAEYLVARR